MALLSLGISGCGEPAKAPAVHLEPIPLSPRNPAEDPVVYQCRVQAFETSLAKLSGRMSPSTAQEMRASLDGFKLSSRLFTREQVQAMVSLERARQVQQYFDKNALVLDPLVDAILPKLYTVLPGDDLNKLSALLYKDPARGAALIRRRDNMPFGADSVLQPGDLLLVYPENATKRDIAATAMMLNLNPNSYETIMESGPVPINTPIPEDENWDLARRTVHAAKGYSYVLQEDNATLICYNERHDPVASLPLHEHPSDTYKWMALSYKPGGGPGGSLIIIDETMKTRFRPLPAPP